MHSMTQRKSSTLQRIAILVQGMNAGVYERAITLSPNKQTKQSEITVNARKILYIYGS